MSDQRRQRRGRPKGTGINDWERLLLIASVIEKDPGLKVTTAIKKLGFSDPSVIRRLRDKFKVNRDNLMRDGSAASRTPSAEQAVREQYLPEGGQAGVRTNSSVSLTRPQRPVNGHAAVSAAVGDYVVFTSSPARPFAGLEASLMRCLLPHPGRRCELAHHQPHVIPGYRAQ